MKTHCAHNSGRQTSVTWKLTVLLTVADKELVALTAEQFALQSLKDGDTNSVPLPKNSKTNYCQRSLECPPGKWTEVNLCFRSSSTSCLISLAWTGRHALMNIDNDDGQNKMVNEIAWTRLYTWPSIAVVASLSSTLRVSPGICSCILTSVFHRAKGLCLTEWRNKIWN